MVVVHASLVESDTVVGEAQESNLGQNPVVGHTPQIDGSVLNLGHLVCIDTGCGFGGLLTAFDVGSGQVWQVDESGSWSP